YQKGASTEPLKNIFPKGAFQFVVLPHCLWAVETPPTAGFPGWCLHQPATIYKVPRYQKGVSTGTA
ncbi:MAG: hypothetical protein KGM16_05435, partial [Bacteroidota bacterium]|nr:hypothetical protein [Bacteroidota bacterium]